MEVRRLNNELLDELEKEAEVYELALKTLKNMPEFNELYKGTSVCYSPIKTLERSLSSVYAHIRANKEA